MNKYLFNFFKFNIKLYKKFISPLLGNNCRFYPECSLFYLETLKYNGFIKGHILFLARFIRCNPFYKGGIDYPRKNVSISKCLLLLLKYENNEVNYK